MRKTLLVAKREYIATVRTKTFLLGVLFTPAMIVGIIFLTRLMKDRGDTEAMEDRILAVCDHTGVLWPHLNDLFEEHNQHFPHQEITLEEIDAQSGDPAAAIEAAKERVKSGQMKGLLVIPPNALTEFQSCSVFTNKARDIMFYRLVRDSLRDANRMQIGAELNLPPAALERLKASIMLTGYDVNAKEEKAVDRMAAMMTPFAFMFMMFMGIFGISQGLLTSVIEEKSSRIMEVLLSGLSSMQLMAGKIIGMGGVGITLMALWITAGYCTAYNQGMQSLLAVEYPGWFLAYYLLGFLLLSSVLAALGSAVNSLKEAQSLMTPITLMMVVPMMAWFFIMQHPNSWWVVAMSFFPPITPFVMVLRLCGAQEVPFWQLPATLLALGVGALCTMWLSARIFRVGVLMYGKPPTPRELLRWLAYK